MSASGAHGFAGLATLVSDVTADIAEAERLGRLRQTAPAPSVAPTPAASVVRAPLGGMSAGAKWLLGLGVVFAAAWLIGMFSNHPNAPQADLTSAPPASGANTTNPAPSVPEIWPSSPPVPDTPVPAPTPAPPPVVFTPDEVKPPAGTDLLLDAGQIRYCLAEAIRIGTIKALIDSQRQSTQDVDRFNRGVDHFNARVNDYNSRCSQYKYYRDTFQRVHDEVEGQRATIEDLARAQWQSEQ